MSRRLLAATAALIALSFGPARAATKAVDLDGQAANGAESKCDLNVLSSFPITIETVVTNKAIGDAFDFSWASAGPGGFTSSVTPGSTGGVGAKWTWSTNQTVYAFTGSTCDRDVCFLKTQGPDALNGTCSTGCLEDGVSMSMARGASAGQVVLNWTGGTAAYTVFRSNVASRVTEPANALTATSLLQYSDTPPAGGIFFYRVRASTCITLKPCSSNANCAPASEGICVSRGPFSVPGRSLTSTDITVSSASLTSSLITFFSPPKEVFKVTVIAQPGGTLEKIENPNTQDVTYESPSYPPGCCPSNPDAPHQLRCPDGCVDYLDDPLNCGGCGNVCGEGECCSNGNCESLCGEGQAWCDGVCIDISSDSNNCGACGNVCTEGTCCSGGGFCASLCEVGRTYCDGQCFELSLDPLNCGACGNVCAAGSVCSAGVCTPCGASEDICLNRCVNLETDSFNCGTCGHDCNATCPAGYHGVCGENGSCSCAPGSPGPRPIPGLTFPTEASCANPNDHPDPHPEVCPSPGNPAPEVNETPICTIDPVTTTIPAGGETTICRPGGVLFREVPAQVSVCGDSIPGPDGACQGGVSNVATGTLMRLVPDTETQIGDAFLTPYAVHVISDNGNDGLIQALETASVLVDVVNAGPVPILGATATLIGHPVDLTDDGVDNPVGATILSGTSSYGTIPGTVPSTNCEPVTLSPTANSTPFRFTLPSDFPGDTTLPFTILFQGTVGGAPFSMEMPIAIGVADRCDYASANRDYDGIDGLMNPLAKLVPMGDPVPFPSRALNAGNTAPLKMRQLCGGVELRGSDVDAPQIVGLSEATRGELDISTMILNDDFGSSDPFFRWNESTKRWIFNLRTTPLGTGVFTIRIRIAGRKDYQTGFELR